MTKKPRSSNAASVNPAQGQSPRPTQPGSVQQATNRPSNAPARTNRPVSAEPKKKRGCGCCLARLFAFFLMFVMVVIIAAFIWRFVTFNQLQTKLAEYGARGEIFGAEHLNSLYAPEPNAEEATALLAAACDDVTSNNFVNQSLSLPFVGEVDPPPYNEEWEQLAEAKELLSQYERAANQLREFGKLGGHAHFPIDFSLESGLDGESIEMMNQGFNFLWLDSRVHIAEQNAPLLAENIRTALVYSNSVSDIPSEDQNWRLTYDESALRLLRIGLSTVNFEKQQLDDFNSLLQGNDYRDGLKRMLQGAKVVGNQFFQDPTGYYQTQMQTQAVEELPMALRNQQQAEMILKYSPTAHEDHVAFLNAIDEYEKIVELPWEDMVEAFAELSAEHEQRFSGRVAENRYPFAPQLLPDYTSYVDRVQKILLTRHMLYAALAVKRYEATEERMPVHFRDLAPTYANPVPADPFLDEPLRFLKYEDRFTVYSVGPNGEDERGSSSSDDIRISLPLNRFDGEGPSTVELDFD